jgi:hypothetical protein
MSSRIDYWDGDGTLPEGLWIGQKLRAINGKRGQALLREVEAALLALPEHRLIEGAMCRDGEVCVLGALAADRERRDGQSFSEALATVEACFPNDNYPPDDVSDALGITRTLGWLLMEQNDEAAATFTPEQRWDWLFAWVRNKLRLAAGQQGAGK